MTIYINNIALFNERSLSCCPADLVAQKVFSAHCNEVTTTTHISEGI